MPNSTRRASRLVALVAAMVVVCMPLVGGAALAAVGSPSLAIEPAEGVPGAAARFVAEGFDQCPLEGNDDVGFSTVTVVWDPGEAQIELGTESLSAGTATLVADVPSDAGEGVFTVVAQCDGDIEIAAEARFAVVPPVTTVPDLLGMSIERAEVTLLDAGLALGEVSGVGDTVIDQIPAAGTEADRGSAVGITVEPAEPVLVAVPEVLGLPLSDARDVLAEAGLALGEVFGTGDVVGDQSPLPGVRVPPDSAVDLTMRETAPVTVVVPDLIGMSAQDALRTVDRLGLRLIVSTSSDTGIISQVPAPGTVVAVGTDVTVVTSSAASLLIWVFVAMAAVLILLIAGAVAMQVRRVRNRARRRWVAEHVGVRAALGLPSTEVATPQGEAPRAHHVVRIEPHEGAHHHDIEEVRS